MGLYHMIDAPDITCHCGGTVTGWQSKDETLVAIDYPSTIERYQVSNYYAHCDGNDPDRHMMRSKREHHWHEFYWCGNGGWVHKTGLSDYGLHRIPTRIVYKESN